MENKLPRTKDMKKTKVTFVKAGTPTSFDDTWVPKENYVEWYCPECGAYQIYSEGAVIYEKLKNYIKWELGNMSHKCPTVCQKYFLFDLETPLMKLAKRVNNGKNS